jgi:hypothetical protein
MFSRSWNTDIDSRLLRLPCLEIGLTVDVTRRQGINPPPKHLAHFWVQKSFSSNLWYVFPVRIMCFTTVRYLWFVFPVRIMSFTTVRYLLFVFPVRIMCLTTVRYLLFYFLQVLWVWPLSVISYLYFLQYFLDFSSI